jgi:hypothetical protein
LILLEPLHSSFEVTNGFDQFIDGALRVVTNANPLISS